MAAPSDSLPADNFPVPGEYDGTEGAGNLDYPTVGPRAPINYRELEQIDGGGGGCDPGYQLSSGSTGNLDHPTVSTTMASFCSYYRKMVEYIQATGGGDSDSLGVQLSSGGTGNLDHSAISTTPASIRSSALSNDLEMGEYLQPIGGGGFGSDWAQLSSGGTGNLDHREMSATPVSIRPRALGNYQEMVDYGGGCSDSYLHYLQSNAQSYQLSYGGTGNLDNPMISAVPASIMTTAERAHLEELGYLQPIDGGGDHDILSIRSAVERYQLNHGLDSTGFIDGPTKLMMSSRLCGVPDIVDGMNLTRLHGGGAACLTLHSGGVRKWDRFVLFYKFESNFLAAAKPGFRRALEEWARNSPFTFLERPGAGPVDILVGFYRGKHGRDCASFNGPGGPVAHGFSPPDGRLHFDKIQPWSFLNHRGYFVDMETVALHEMGHVLGLSHSSDRNSVMYCGVAPCQIKRRLTAGDIEAFQSLYS